MAEKKGILASGLAWDHEDVRQMYRFALRREPESEATVEHMQTLTGDALVRTFFTSPEFVSQIDDALARGDRPFADERSTPAEPLRAWAASRFPLSPAGRRAVLSAQVSWTRLYWILLSDPEFQRAIGGDARLPQRLEGLEAAAAVDGRVEAVDGDSVRGWAVRFDYLDRSTRVEVWCGDLFYCATTADLFRRDVQDRFGGEGRAGFELTLPQDPGRAALGGAIEIRAGGVVIGRGSIPHRERELDGIAAAARELAEIRALVERLEARIPWVEAGLAQPFSNYGSYAATWRDTGMDAPASACRSLVVVDAVGRSARELDDTVRSLLAQTVPPNSLSVALIVDAAQQILAEDLRNRCAWQGLGGVSVHVLDAMPLPDRVMAAVGLVGERGDVCLAISAGDQLAEGALRRVSARMDRRAQVQAVYFDEDRFCDGEHEMSPELRRRENPVLKPGFDRDLLLQTPYVGQGVAFRMAALRQHGLDRDAGEHFAAELLLRLSAAGGDIDHIGRVLLSRWSPSAPSVAWRQVVEAHVRAGDEGAAVVDHADQLGAHVAGAVRLRHRPNAAKACIIIATKDALDLLRPCVESIQERRAANATPHELLIIDHQSADPEVNAYLAELEQAGEARILPYEGDFNWALMNNLAAAQTDAEVLVFLNNDTVVVTRDWLDELVSQAQRPEVGVVGCRLIYEDGTIQHAGFVAREELYSFLTHEGVGQAGGDAGYLGRHALLHSCVAVTGACMAVRADVFHALGGFDSATFPIEGNDVDLCLRAQTEGLRVLYDPYATLFHLESKSRGFNTDPERRARAEAASRLLWNRWGERFSRDPGFNPHFDRLSRPFTRLRPPPAYAG